jgi:hypothetical protein
MGGADTIEGGKAFFLIDWFAASLTAKELKFYVGISWISGLVILLFNLLS